MIRQIRKWFIIMLKILIPILLIFLVYSWYKGNPRKIKTLPAQVEEIRQTVKLSSLEITTEEIFKDTIYIKGVVSRVKANVYIGFDIENIPMMEQGDTLVVQLPPEIIEVYESTNNGYEVLDVWNLQFPDEMVDTPLSIDEENQIKSRFKRRIADRMYEKGYVKRARENAVRSLATLFSKFKNHVIIVDNHPDGWRDSSAPSSSEITLSGQNRH